MDIKDKRKQGKKNRQKGSEWERRVRKDLEGKGWIVDKWSNNVEFKEYGPGEHKSHGVGILGKLIPAKRKYNPFNKAFAIGTGFPDFSIHKAIAVISEKTDFGDINMAYFVIGIEAKVNGYLDKKEREKCEWLLKNNIFSRIFVAYKTKEKNKVIVNYKVFKYNN